MKKSLYLLLIALLIVNYRCEDSEEEEEVALERCLDSNAQKGKDCKKISLPGGFHCCYASGKGTEKSGCFPITDENYKDIDKFIEQIEKQNGGKDISVDCASKYIIVSFLSLIILFL